MNVTVILPTLNPTARLLDVAEGLQKVGFSRMIIIDDGSDKAAAPIFTSLEQMGGVTVLHHPQNMGKGCALKTGFSYFLEHCGDEQAGVVTTDDDGQHAAKDIAACAEKMQQTGSPVYGVRDFNNANIPFKSRLGNKLTGFIFRWCCGINLSDTQTGLRALPKSCLPLLGAVKGERFEYETNALLALKQAEIDFIAQPIFTIYENNNKSTHFSAVRDSARIYAMILKYLASSVSSSVVDVALFTLLNLMIPSTVEVGVRVLIANVVSRLASSLLNFAINRNGVFKSRTGLRKTMPRYYLLLVVQMAASYGIVMGLSTLFGLEQSLWQTVIKMITDVALFFASFYIQREWVFGRK